MKNCVPEPQGQSLAFLPRPSSFCLSFISSNVDKRNVTSIRKKLQFLNVAFQEGEEARNEILLISVHFVRFKTYFGFFEQIFKAHFDYLCSKSAVTCNERLCTTKSWQKIPSIFNAQPHCIFTTDCDLTEQAFVEKNCLLA